MTVHVVEARIYFADADNAENAYEHVRALAQHAAAHDVQVGAEVQTSWGTIHQCDVDTHHDPAQCQIGRQFEVRADVGLVDGEPDLPPKDPDDPDPGDVQAWVPGETVEARAMRSYEDVVYECLQGHDTQEGWEPPNVPALWEPA